MPAAPKTIGRYELIEIIGQGGMGRVYRARDPLIDRVVAIKTIELAPSGGDKEEVRERILREVRAAGRLQHPHIVQIFDVGELPDQAYIVMELVEGRTLWEIQDEGETVAPAEALRILRQVAEGLDYAHSQGIIHRDVKPGNILVTRQGVAKITDFGIARILTDERLTQTGVIVGTPHYMAPEQLQEVGVGPKADQFALAVNAYELLTGEKPFDGQSFSSLLYMVLNEDPAPVTEIRPDLPAGVEAALKKALAKDPKNRYESCGAMAEALERAMVAPGPAPAPPPPEPRPTRLAPWVLLLAGGALAVAAAAVFLQPGPGEGESPGQASVTPRSGTPQPVLPAPVTRQEESPQPEAPEPEAKEPETPQPKPPELEPSANASRPPQQAPAKTAEAPPPAVVREPAKAPAAVASGPAVTLVWRGRLAPGETLLIENGSPSAGSLSKPLPAEPIAVEVSPANGVEILEAPGPNNGWAKLRVRNSEHDRTMFLVRYRELRTP